MRPVKVWVQSVTDRTSQVKALRQRQGHSVWRIVRRPAWLRSVEGRTVEERGLQTLSGSRLCKARRP